MKKFGILILTMMFILTGCGSSGADGVDVDIKEKLFISQTNDVYLNPDDYVGKTIRLEGMFSLDYDVVNEENRYYVIRYGPGCCGYDANAGFEVAWDKDYPEDNDWVEAVGELEVYENEEGYETLRLKLNSLEVKDERGAETVET